VVEVRRSFKATDVLDVLGELLLIQRPADRVNAADAARAAQAVRNEGRRALLISSPRTPHPPLTPARPHREAWHTSCFIQHGSLG